MINVKRRRGFTMVELMIVVLIIVILGSMAVARYMYMRDKGTLAAATCDLNSVRKFLAYYSTDHESFPAAAATYEDLKEQMVDLQGRPYGPLPLSNSYTWLSYDRDSSGNYVVRIQVQDRNHTVLVATPDLIRCE